VGLHRIAPIARNHEHRNAIAVRVIDGHRSVLQTDGAMQQGHHRTALDLGVTVGHRNRRLFVTARQKLRHFVAAVVEERFVQPAETGAGIRRDEFEVQGFENIHHEIGSGVFDGPRRSIDWRKANVSGDLLCRGCPGTRRRHLRIGNGRHSGKGG